MTEPTFRVYVSSTWLDLQAERDAVKEAILRMRATAFVGMEYFGSRDETTRRASLDDIDRSEIYVGIIAARYGSGITEAEYRRARERGVPCLIYFKQDASIPEEWRETDPEQIEKLDDLKRELRDPRHGHLIGPDFLNPHDLAARLTADLHRWLFDNYLKAKLEEASRGELPGADTQALLDSIKDLSALNQDLLARLRPSTVSAQHQLRAPVGDFVGREKEINELTKILRGGGSASISGMGGTGKSELALLVANRLRDVYPDAQLLIDMRGTDKKPRDPAGAVAACVRAFVGLEAKLPESLEDLTQLYRDALDGKRALILLDNAFDGAQVRPLLPPAGSALLVTSRNLVSLPRMTRVTLEQLPPGEARELLTSIAPRVAPDIADQICSLCGYLPLAVRAAGSLLDVTVDLDPSDYAAQLRDERTRLGLIGTEGVDVDVGASFNLSYQRLEPEAARVFRRLAVFPSTFDAAAEEAVCEDAHKHLSGLVRRSLVLYDAAVFRYRLHDLARLFADTRLGAEERGASRMRHAAHYQSVLWEADTLYEQGGEALNRGLALFDREWRNIQTGQRWAAEQSDGDDAAAELCTHFPDAGAYLLNLRQHPREQILWREAALAAARRLKNRDAEGVHLSNLGLAYNALGETRRAIEFFEQRLVIAREIGDRRGEANTLGYLGLAYDALGETARAVEFYEQNLIIAREIGDRRGESNALGNLGTGYCSLGEASRAVEFHEQHLAIARELGDRRGEGNALGNLGVAYDALGETGRAAEFYEQQLAIARELGDRGGEGRALGNLGNAYDKLGDTRRAVEFYEQRIAISRELGDRRGEGIVLFNICLALDTLGDRAQAISYAQAALEIFEQIESPYAANARAALDEWRGQAGQGEGGG